jgi:hypothetical protein
MFGSYQNLRDNGLIIDRNGCRCPRVYNKNRCNGKLVLNDKCTKFNCLVKYDKKSAGQPCKIPISVFRGSFFDRIRMRQVKPEQVLLIARHLLEGYTLEQSHQETKISMRTIWKWRRKIKSILAAARLNEVSKYTLIVLFILYIILFLYL